MAKLIKGKGGKQYALVIDQDELDVIFAFVNIVNFAGEVKDTPDWRIYYALHRDSTRKYIVRDSLLKEKE